MKTTEQRKQEQYEAALAKPPEKRNWLERQLVKAGDQRVGAIAEAADAKQMIRVYSKGDVAKEFQHDAARLAKDGWRVQSQTAGGQTSNVGKALLFGPLALAAGRKTKEITVVYVRD